MVEQDPVAGIHPITFAVIHRDPIGIELRDAIGAARVERRVLLLRCLLHQAEELTGACLIDPGLLREAQNPHCLQYSQRAQSVAVGGVFRTLKTHSHMALGTEVIDLIGLHLLNDPDQVGAIGEVAVVENQAGISFMRVLVEVINSTGIETARAALESMHLVTLLQQQLRQVAAVLPGDTGNQGGFLRG